MSGARLPGEAALRIGAVAGDRLWARKGLSIAERACKSSLSGAGCGFARLLS